MDGTSPMEAKNISRSASDADVAASLVTSGNGRNDTANLLSPNNSEEPLPLGPQLAPVLTQVSIPYSEVTCVCINPCS